MEPTQEFGETPPSETRPCVSCGAKLNTTTPDGLCVACLLEGGLFTNTSQAAETSNPILGDYELLAEIAHGGMGIVYRARQRSLGRIVAIKTVLAGRLARAEDIARFRREAEAAAHLKHPNIVAIHEVGESDGQHFFSMDYIEGRTLRQLTQDTPLSAQRAAECLKTIAEAVHFAHERGVVHRDLKPSNVLVDALGQPHVTDFGLAKQIDADADLTVSGMAMGTPGYMPPEQARGQSKTVGPLADVYALGAILYDLLTGRPPFRAETPHETLAQTMNQDPVAPRLLNAAVPRDLETICLKCLEKEPARRYETAQALAEDLGRLLRHEPVHAQPPSAIYRARKFVRRHRVAVAVAAGCAVVLAAATAVSTVFGWRAELGRKAAVASKIQMEKAEREAKSNAENSQVILTFLKEQVLAAPRPDGLEGGLGRDVTLRKVIETAEPQVALLFSNRPIAEAGIRGALGTTFRHLGDWTNAIVQHERALQLTKAVLGSREPATLEAMNDLANSYQEAWRYAESAALHQEVLAAMMARYGTNHDYTLRSLNNLGISYNGIPQRNADAILVLEEALQVSKRLNGVESQETLFVMNNLAKCYEKAHRKEEAIMLKQEVYKIRSSMLPPNHPHLLVSIFNLAASYADDGRASNALELLESVLPLQREQFGPASPNVIATMAFQARALDKTGQSAEALQRWEEVVRLTEETHGPNHPLTLGYRIHLAKCYRTAGRQTNALTVAKETLRRYETAVDFDPLDRATCLNELGVVSCELGNWSNSIPYFEQALEVKKARLSPDDSSRLVSVRNLAKAYARLGRTNDANAVSAQTAIREAAGLTPADSLPATTPPVGGAETPQTNLTARLRLLRQLSSADGTDLAGRLAELSDWLLGSGDVTNAEPLLRESLAIYEKKQPDLSPFFATQGLLGWSLLAQKKYADAEPLLVSAHKGLSKRQVERPSASRVRAMQAAAEHLAQLYDACGKPDEAAKWREKLK